MIFWFLLTISNISFSFGTTHTVTNSGFSFSPSNLAINLGDTVSFLLESSHDAVEVSQSTWNANGNTSNGGFSTPLGGGKVIPTVVGTYYYVCSPHASFGMKGTITVNPTTEIKDSKNYKPSSFILYQNYPNPFNPTTTISFVISNLSLVTLKIFNVLGQEVNTLLNNEELDPGYQTVEIDANSLASGLYYYRLTVDDFENKSERITETRKMILLK